MSNGITLTSAMRNNLGALKYLSGQMDITQTRLATGQKVNSAIDNASSFYQARALTNRASDLDRLLDSMGQSIQTINAAISGLEQAGATLEQAAVVAQQAYETAIIPEKAWFEAQVGENGAVVSTAQELKDAINSGKETICVYGKIDLGEITSGLSLKKNQKLVGVGYFGDFDSEVNKFSAISATSHTDRCSLIKVVKVTNVMISDLEITYNNTSSLDLGSVYFSSSNNAVVKNININFSGSTSGGYSLGGIWNYASKLSLQGIVNIKNDGFNQWGIYAVYNAITEVEQGGKININTNGCQVLYNRKGAKFIIKSGAQCYFNNNFYNIAENYDDHISSIEIEKGAQLAFVRNNNTKWREVTEDFSENLYHSSATTNFSNFDTKIACKEVQPWQLIENDDKEKNNVKAILTQSSEQYVTAMNAYDDMIKDSSYQGINLLTGGNLTTMFNETRSNSFKVEGANMTAESLGITTREWQTKEDIAQSIKEIKDAMYKVRDMVEVLGNNLSIIETRMNFTDALTDILQIGADELVLADMNEESANYLALQTRQQLAVNALSLAAQSSSAVLKLF